MFYIASLVLDITSSTQCGKTRLWAYRYARRCERRNNRAEPESHFEVGDRVGSYRNNRETH